MLNRRRDFGELHIPHIKAGSTYNLRVSITTKMLGSNAPVGAPIKFRPWGWLYNKSVRLSWRNQRVQPVQGGRVFCILRQLGRACPAEHNYSTVSFNQKKHGSLREKSKG